MIDLNHLRPHDLVKLSLSELKLEQAPDWVGASLKSAPFAVIRRSEIENSLIPIGVRGQERNQRWAALISVDVITEKISPEVLIERVSLIDCIRMKEIAALTALSTLIGRLGQSPWQWGPTGSVGFELVSGQKTATVTSDLDLILRCNSKVEKAQLKEFQRQLQGLGVRCDTIIETPNGGVALNEYTNETEVYVLRTNNGPILTSDPWK